MVIDYGNLFRSGVRPPEDNAPLAVDTDGMETRQVALKRPQTVTGGTERSWRARAWFNWTSFRRPDSGYRVKATTLLRSK